MCVKLLSASAPLLAVIFLFCAPASAAAAGLLGGWNLDEGAGHVTADAAGRGHEGRLGLTSGPDAHDPAWVSGRFGAGLRFDGAQNQYVAIARPETLSPALITVEAWVRRAGTPGMWRYVVSSGGQGCDFSSFGLYSGFQGGLAFYVGGSSSYVTSPDAAPEAVWDGSWHHAVGTYDGGHVRLYVDGVEVGSGTPTGLTVDYGLDARGVYIGTYRGSCELPFTGDVDGVAIRDGALTATEVAGRSGALAQRPMPAQSGPVSGPPAKRRSKGRSCFIVRVEPGRVSAQRRTRLRIAVRRLGRSAAGKRVLVRGAGLRRSVKTGRKGRARLVVKPRRGGRLKVSVKGQPRRCDGGVVKVSKRKRR